MYGSWDIFIKVKNFLLRGPKMTIIKIEKPIVCRCGYEITEMEMLYGRTPYRICCKECGTSLRDFFPSGIGWHLQSKHAIEGFREMCEVAQWLKDTRQKDTPQRIGEYFYRKYKNWGSNPCKFKDHIG